MTIWIPELASGTLPKYKKLADAIDQAILNNILKSGYKLPPQRQLADALQVTTGTVTRGYNESERRGSVVARVGSGTYVKSNKPSQYVRHDIDEDCFDLHSAKAPMGMQLEMITSALKQIADEQQMLTSCLSYQPEAAMDHQREQLAQWLTGRKNSCGEQNVLFTYGGQHGISLALQSTCRAGDTVLCEGLSFPGINVACQQQQLRCVGLQMDDNGITVESLKAACVQSHPRVLYLTAQIQNPTSVQMPLSRKKQIVEICQHNGVIILDDDVQFLPQYDKVSSFYQLDPEITIYISSFSKSFSKSFSGGIRIGYLVASEKLISALKVSLRASCWTMPPLMIEIVCRWLASGKMDKLEAWLTTEMAERNAIMQEILAGFEVTFQPHGFNAWLALPEPWRAVDFVEYAEHKGVLIRSAESYAIGRFHAPQNIRICTSAPKNQKQLKQALELLKTCLSETSISGSLVM